MLHVMNRVNRLVHYGYSDYITKANINCSKDYVHFMFRSAEHKTDAYGDIITIAFVKTLRQL